MAALPVILGTDRAEQLKGTNSVEVIRGLGDYDEIVNGRGKDVVRGGTGMDNLVRYGGDTSVDRFSGGNNTVQSRDVPAVKDTVSCRAGTDTVYAGEADAVSGDCERVEAW